MKKIKFLLVASAIATVWSCKTNDDDQPVEPKSDPQVKLEIEHKFGDDDFELGKTYDVNGTKVKFTAAQFYLSDLHLEDDGAVREDLEKEVVFVTTETIEFNLGQTEIGHKHKLKGYLGVDSLTNKTVQPTDFINGDEDNPLGGQVPSMHWSWNTGYIFMKFEGELDYDGDGQMDTLFAYHLGTQAVGRAFEKMLHHDLGGHDGEENEDLEIGMEFDYQSIFDNLDLNTENDTRSLGPPEKLNLAMKITDNFFGAIKVELHDHN